MAFSLVASAKGEGAVTGGTTSSIDTTGANLIVVAVAGLVTSASVSDNKSNTYTSIIQSAAVDGGFVRLYYCYSPTVGSGHTFTVSGTYIYSGIVAQAFSGADTSPLDQYTSNSSGTAQTSGTPGSITPTENNELIIFAGPSGNSGSFFSSVSVGSVAQSTTGTSETDYSIGAGYYAQGAAAAINPTMTWNQSTKWAAVIASFKGTGGGGATGTLAVTESGADTAALVGDVYVSGALAVTESGSDTAALSGFVVTAGVPSLSAATVVSIATTTATPRITLTFA